MGLKSFNKNAQASLQLMYFYTSLRSFIGLGLLFWSFKIPLYENYIQELVIPSVILIMLIIVSVELSITVKERTHVTLGMCGLMAAILMFEPSIAAIIASFGFASGILTRPNYRLKHRLMMTFSMLGYACLLSFIGSLMLYLVQVPVPITEYSILLLAKLLLVYLSINLAMAFLIMPSIILRGASWRDYLNVEFPIISIFNFFGFLAGTAMAILVQVSTSAILLVALPIMVTMYLLHILNKARSDLKQRVKELTILHEVSREITRLLKLEQLSSMLHHESKKVISSPGFRIALKGDSVNELTIVLDVVEGRRSRSIGESAANTFEEHVLKNGKPLRIDRWPDQSDELGLTCMEEPWVHSYLGVPMIFEDKCIGVIGLRSPDFSTYTEHHLDILLHFANNTAVAIENSRLYKEVETSFVSTVEALVRLIDAKDPYTRNHSLRVAHVATELAREIGLSEDNIEMTRLASLLHDIGKVGLPETLLQKKGDLNEEERLLIQQHPEKGGDLVSGIDRLREIIPIIKRHHERIDGSGYPYGIKGEDIPITARIIAVADAFDAIISERPYRKSMSFSEAIKELRRCKGSQFDSDVVDAFERIYARNHFVEFYRDM
ncbi:HD domain-containing protein [bacterium]|nr:HD domain-containing protein [candidate division CSSED10-310 bacterium]